MAYFLVATSGHAAPLASRTTFVGSDPQMDIPIRADFGLAPRHFVVVQQDSGHCVQSLTSESPVTVNGVPVQFQQLRVGDWIQAGQIALCYQSDSPPEPPPPPEPQAGMYVSEPPPPPAEASEPRLGGYRRPDSPRPLDLDQEDDGPVSPVAALPSLGRSMAVADRARAYVNEQKANQNFSGAIIAGVLAAIVISFVWSISTVLPTIFYFAVASGLGYGVGSAVKWGGGGFDLKFGYTGALCALLCGLSANYVKMSAAHAAAEADDYRRSKSGKVEMYGGDEAQNADLQATFADLGIDPASPDFEEEDPDEVSTGLVALLLHLFGPRSLIAYVIAMGAAYRSSFRTLTADEAARMQYG